MSGEAAEAEARELRDRIFSLNKEVIKLKAEIEAFQGDPNVTVLNPGEKNVWRDQEITNTGTSPVYFKNSRRDPEPLPPGAFVVPFKGSYELPNGLSIFNNTNRDIVVLFPASLPQDPLEAFATYQATDLSKPETWPADLFARGQCQVMAEENKRRGSLNLRSVDEIWHACNRALLGLHTRLAAKRDPGSDFVLRRRLIVVEVQLLLKELMLLCSRERIDLGAALLGAPRAKYPVDWTTILGMTSVLVPGLYSMFRDAAKPKTEPEEETG